MLGYIKEELFKNMTQFINEIELSFDYISPNKITEVNKQIASLRSNEELFSNFVKTTYTHLKTFESSFETVMSGKKYKSDKLDFLNDITLFDLQFNLFKEENKNTKKTLVKYLYTIYMSVFFINMNDGLNDIENDDGMSRFIETMTNAQKAETSQLEVVQKKKHTFTKPAHLPRNLAGMNMAGLAGMAGLNLGGMPGMKGMEDVMASLLGNKEIMSIATEISAQIKTDNINPMNMLSGLMSGKVDGQLGDLMSKIQEKVETKMNSGEINKAAFEEEAKNIFEKVQETDLKNLFQKM